MKHLTLPIISSQFVDKVGKTAIETSAGTVWANGDVTSNKGLLVNITINEVGDQFIAKTDSKTLDAENKPLYTAGSTVTRQKQSIDFKSITGNSQAVAFAQGASAYGLNLQVVMQ